MSEIRQASLVVRACAFATDAHRPQRRKYTGEPYITHCAAVARLVSDHGGTPEMIAAAWLHDVVEDTPATFGDLSQEFGVDVANMVWLLTNEPASTGNRAQRTRANRHRLANSPPAVQTIKLADLIDNTPSIARFDPSFAKVYLAEKAELLGVLADGEPRLRERALAVLQRWQTEQVQEALRR